MKSSLRIILIFTAVGVSAVAAHGQSALDKTTLGKPQNNIQDLENSLVPGEKKYGKGEKKEQVNTAELKSKSTKDSTFGGSLLNMGIDPAAPKLDEQKLHHVQAEKESTSVKPAALNEKQPALLQLADPAALVSSESNQSDAAAGTEKTVKPSDAKIDGHKDEEKPADKEKNKAPANKPDGER